MNKIYRSLLISVGVIVTITVLAYIILQLMKYEIPFFLAFLPVMTITMVGSLALIVKQYLKKDKVLEITEILVVRILFLIPFIILLVVGILMNKNDIVLFAILFAVYYVIFAVTETKTMMKLTNKGI